MSRAVVCKFGGSSVANAGQIEKTKKIIAADETRRYIVVSAPGRSHEREEKVTDHLFNIATSGVHFREMKKSISPDESRKAVIGKFSSIVEGLGIAGTTILSDLEKDLAARLDGDRGTAFLASRGEHYNARIIAEYLGKSGADVCLCLPEEFGLRVSHDYLNAKVLDETHVNIAALDIGERIAVIPGYYGVTIDDEVAVFSRGGSDLTGGEVAYAINADTYENWTDISGVYETNPTVIPEARPIQRLTFKEIRLLSSKGFDIFHFDAMLNCKKRKIPINIRNTNKPEDPGTLILNERVPEEGIVGIARLDNMAYLYLEKDALGREIGFAASLLGIFQEHDINTYFYPTDKDDIAVLVDQDDLNGTINDLRRQIEERLRPDYMDVVYNLSIITPLGLGLKGNSYPIVDAITALAEHHISIEMIDQSPSQICFHIGVSQAVADDALKILYQKLIVDMR